jgi:hypothetical protein
MIKLPLGHLQLVMGGTIRLTEIRTCLLTINASLTVVQKSNEDWSAMLS